MSVYIIECGDYVKIGIAQNAHSRMAALQTGNPYQLKLVADIPGGLALEMELHNDFVEYRTSGEWFHHSGAVKEFVESMAIKYPPKEVVPPRIIKYIRRNLIPQTRATKKSRKLSERNHIDILERAVKAAYAQMPERVHLKRGTVMGKDSVMITLTDFEVRNGAVIDLLVAGKPEVQGGGK